MQAFLNDKLEPLEEICTERSMAVLGTIIKVRATCVRVSV
jgi:hypothetical protein